jgi:hypothetical protein
MSRQIDWSKPLSDEDAAWASQFAIHADNIRANREQFPVEDETVDLEDETDDYSDTNRWKVRDLQMEIERRNSEYGTDMKTDGKRQDLVDRLLEDDRQAAEAERTQ